MHAMAAPAAPVPAPEKALGDGARAASYSSNKMDSLLHGGIMHLSDVSKSANHFAFRARGLPLFSPFFGSGSQQGFGLLY